MDFYEYVHLARSKAEIIPFSMEFKIFNLISEA